MTNTGKSSEHLNVINSVLSLAYNLESYPNHLFEAGYKISRIEPRFNVNGTLEPDIIFMSNDRGLICECKTGEYFIGNNVRRYREITIRHLVEKGIDVPKEDLDLDVGIFGRNNIETLKDRLEEEGITYPQVVIDDVVEKRYGEDFKDPLLRDFFAKQVKINGKPLTILKFTKDSSFKVIAPYIFSSLMARSILRKTQFTSRELAEDELKEIWSNLDSTLRTSLSRKVRDFLRYCKRHELRQYLSNREDDWAIIINEHWKSRKKFSDDCKALIGGLDQKTLWDF